MPVTGLGPRTIHYKGAQPGIQQAIDAWQDEQRRIGAVGTYTGIVNDGAGGELLVSVKHFGTLSETDRESTDASAELAEHLTGIGAPCAAAQRLRMLRNQYS